MGWGHAPAPTRGIPNNSLHQYLRVVTRFLDVDDKEAIELEQHDQHVFAGEEDHHLIDGPHLDQDVEPHGKVWSILHDDCGHQAPDLCLTAHQGDLRLVIVIYPSHSRLPSFGGCQPQCELKKAPSPDGQDPVHHDVITTDLFHLQTLRGKFQYVRGDANVHQEKLRQLIAREGALW